MNKVLIVFCILSGLASSAHAAVDFIECQTSIEDTATHAVSTFNGSYASYRNVSKVDDQGRPYPADIRVTNSEIAFQQSIKSSDLNYKIDYKYDFEFAKRDVGGTPEARQSACSKLSFQICQDVQPGQQWGACSAMQSQCISPSSDPFDPKYGWGVTSIIGGEPVFNERLLTPIKTKITFEPGRYAEVSIDCKFKGTYF